MHNRLVVEIQLPEIDFNRSVITHEYDFPIQVDTRYSELSKYGL